MITQETVGVLPNGPSQGPKTAEGRARCAAATTVHGEEGGAIRRERSIKSAEFLLLEELLVKLGMISGTRTRGRKPNAYYEPRLRKVAASLLMQTISMLPFTI